MRPNNRILIVDDNNSIHRDFRKVLGGQRVDEKRKLAKIEKGLFKEETEPAEGSDSDLPKYSVDSAYQGEEALEMVIQAHEAGKPYALVFMDVRMPPGWDGIETIGHIWARYPEIEMVICTAYSDYSWERILKELGTTDRLLFLRKPFDTTAVKQMALSQTQKWNLTQQSKHYVAKLKEEIKVRRQSEERLQYLAHHDPLTGLANRTRFNLELTQAIEEADKNQVKLALFFIDLDRFKEINDTLGYQNGDMLLKQIAERLRSIIGERGMVARFGGDEFAVLVKDMATTDQASKVAEDIHRGIVPGFMVKDLQLEITASIGIVQFPDHGADADTLMRRADMTMSTAKDSDPGYTFYDPKFDYYSPRRLMLLSELRRAINTDSLGLHFQPKVSMERGEAIGVEALLRWNHPEHGQIYPDEFIPLAERSGLIKPLSMWVLREATRQWAAWKKAGIAISIAVNLSVRDLFDTQIPHRITEFLSAAGMPAEQLMLEITESAMMEDPHLAKSILVNLANMGIKLAIDDFGTGYSSLAYLKNLPVHEIKIDKSFVVNMDKDVDDATIVRSTIDLGHTLGLGVVAEGVEVAAGWKKLKALKCDHAQGYYMSEPLSADDVQKWLKESPWGLKNL